jgi:DNA-binding MarR family transcriptional regulator
VRVSLTDAGRRKIEELFPRFNAEEGRIAGVLDADGQDRLARMLRALTRAVDGRLSEG